MRVLNGFTWLRIGSLPGDKRPELEVDGSFPSNVEVKNVWSYTHIVPRVFMAWCLIKWREALSLRIPS
jgi:hypothetical protein